MQATKKMNLALEMKRLIEEREEMEVGADERR